MFLRKHQYLSVLYMVLVCTCVYSQGSKTLFYKSGDILVEEEQDGTVKLCYILGDRELISRKIKSLPDDSAVIETTAEEIQNIINKCPTDIHRSRQKRQTFDLIYPGTKWCGRGNVSRNFDDLGEHNETDMCCRNHDFCPDTISAFQTRHGLFNSGFFTISHCECEEEFYNCLKNSTDELGSVMGNLYFNYLDFDCFEMRNVSTCIKSGWWYSSCQRYGFRQQMTFVPFKEF